MSEARMEPDAKRSNTPTTTTSRPATTDDMQLQVTGKQSGDAVQLQTENGKTVISDTVVSKIVGAAAREIDGVYELVAMGAGATIAGLAGRITRADQRSTGVNVEVGQREAAVDLNMVVEYGVNIPQVADAVRQNVTDRVRGMTGLIVKEINVNVADLHFATETEQPRVQ